MKAYGEVEVQLQAFSCSALGGGVWSASRPCLFTPGERIHGSHWTGGCVGHRAGLDAVAKKKIPALAGKRTSVVQP